MPLWFWLVLGIGGLAIARGAREDVAAGRSPTPYSDDDPPPAIEAAHVDQTAAAAAAAGAQLQPGELASAAAGIQQRRMTEAAWCQDTGQAAGDYSGINPQAIDPGHNVMPGALQGAVTSPDTPPKGLGPGGVPLAAVSRFVVFDEPDEEPPALPSEVTQKTAGPMAMPSSTRLRFIR